MGRCDPHAKCPPSPFGITGRNARHRLLSATARHLREQTVVLVSVGTMCKVLTPPVLLIAPLRDTRGWSAAPDSPAILCPLPDEARLSCCSSARRRPSAWRRLAAPAVVEARPNATVP